MTVESAVLRVEYQGDGAQTEFSYPFRVLEAEELQVVKTDLEGQNPQFLTLGSDYTVDGVGDQEGGTVTLATAPAADERVVIRRHMSLLQKIDLLNQGPYLADVHEESFDRRAMTDQELADALKRCLSIPWYAVNGHAAYNAHGNKIEDLKDPTQGSDAATLQSVEQLVTSLIEGGLSVAPQSWEHDCDGSTTRYGIPGCPSNSPHLYDVSLDGLVQAPGTDYSIDYDAEEVVFPAAPPAGARLLVRQKGYPRGYTLLPEYTSSTLPTPDESLHGRLVLVKDPGKPEELRCCMRRASGAWEWTIIGLASP